MQKEYNSGRGDKKEETKIKDVEEDCWRIERRRIYINSEGGKEKRNWRRKEGEEQEWRRKEREEQEWRRKEVDKQEWRRKKKQENKWKCQK